MVAGMIAGALASAVLAVGGGAGADGYWMTTDARFAPPGAFVPSAALTYDKQVVPAAGGIEVTQLMDERGATTVRLRVTGVKAGHAFGARVHQKSCAADPAAAGGVYQHREDPAHTDPDNEVWLDFTADEKGTGDARTRHDWGFRPGGAGSVVLYDGPGAGGARLACFTVPFGWVAGTA